MVKSSGQGGVNSRDIKGLDDQLRAISESVEQSNRWLSWRQCSLIDHYIRGEMNIGLRRTLSDEAQHGFIITMNNPGGKGGESPPANSKRRGTDLKIEQSSMFSLNVELMKQPQQFISSLVRFERFEDFSFGCGKPVYEFISLEPRTRIKKSGVINDRKVMLVRPVHVVAMGEACSQEIKGCSDAIEVCPKLGIERKRQIAFCDRYKNVIGNIRFRIFDTHIDITIDPSVQSSLEGWEFGYGPINGGLSF